MAQRSALKALSPVTGNTQKSERKLIAWVMDHVGLRANGSTNGLHLSISAATQLFQGTLLAPMEIISRLQRRGESAIFALFVELGNLASGLNSM